MSMVCVCVCVCVCLSGGWREAGIDFHLQYFCNIFFSLVLTMYIIYRTYFTVHVFTCLL